MRATEFLKESEVVQEIERLSPTGFSGGKEHLNREYDTGKIIKKLPGGSGLLYSIEDEGSSEFKIRLWDPVNKGEYQPSAPPVKYDWISNREQKERIKRWEIRNKEFQSKFNRAPGKLVGELTVHKAYILPLKNAVQVGVITVDEDYRGVGLAKALYGIVLTIMKRPLVAGTSQTPGGRRNWVSLSQIPGVEMKGYFSVDNLDLHTMDTSHLNPRTDDVSWAKRQNKQADKTIDTIMGKLGGQYIGKDSDGELYFAFDVKPSTTGKELESYVKTNMSKVYGDYNSSSGLYAVWNARA
jgi:ribosomal protein S18 acetylase RimI-like enzyme